MEKSIVTQIKTEIIDRVPTSKKKFDRPSSIEENRALVGKFFTDQEREDKIKKEFRKLKRLIKGLEKSTVAICVPLMQNIAFCVVELEELRNLIKQAGLYQIYQNGEHQRGVKKSIASDLYIQIGKNYSMFLGKLKDFLPVGVVESDELTTFEKKHKKK